MPSFTEADLVIKPLFKIFPFAQTVFETIKNIRINNKILHQSKLINYFIENYPIKDVEKDLNDLLKKIKRDKKYFFSKKDIILLESLKSDGIKFSKKYDNLWYMYMDFI